MKAIRKCCVILSALLLAGSDLFAQPTVYGGGTPNYLAKFTSSNPVIVGQSVIYDNGINIGIGSTSLSLARLVVSSASDNIAWFTGANSAMVIVNNTGESEFVGRDAGNTAYKAISFRANSTTGQLYLAPSGNVGIGTTTPGQKLDVNGTIRCTQLMFGDGTIQSTAGGGGGTSQWSTYGSGIYFNGGNVGIGTTSPTLAKLSVVNVSTDNIAWYAGNNSAMVIVNNLNESEFVGRDAGNSSYRAISFRANSTTGQLYLTTSGNVGIGTTTPGQKLDVIGNIRSSGDMTVGGGGGLTLSGGPIYMANNAAVWMKNTSGVSSAVLFADGSSNINIGDYSNALTGSIIFRTTGQPRMSIASGGNVGIGTTSPSYKLDVAGDIRSSGNLYVSGSNGFLVGEASGFTRISYSSQAFSLLTLSNGPANLNAGGIAVTNIYNVTPPTNGMYVQGNVGIGITTPGQKLSVAGTVESTTGGFKFPDGTIQTTASGGGVSQWTTSGVNIYSSNSGNVGVGTASPTQKLDVAGGIAISGTSMIDAGRNIVNAGSGAFSGNVIIGNRTTTSYKLDIVGNVRANEVVVNTDGSDFVFEEGYKLMDLPALAAYVKENKHLPDIASADEMQKGGLGIGEMQTKLLQKVEELTLYVIDQEKRIQEQNRRIEKLEKENAELRSKQ